MYFYEIIILSGNLKSARDFQLERISVEFEFGWRQFHSFWAQVGTADPTEEPLTPSISTIPTYIINS